MCVVQRPFVSGRWKALTGQEQPVEYFPQSGPSGLHSDTLPPVRNMKLNRTLRFRPSPTAPVRLVKIEIGEPYHPPRSKGPKVLRQPFACELSIDDVLTMHEVTGRDAMGAVGAALMLVHVYLEARARRGELTWESGEPYINFVHSPVPEFVEKAANAEIQGLRNPAIRLEAQRTRVLQNHRCSKS